MDRSSTVQFLKRDFAPTWRLANAARSLAHLRHPSPLNAEGRRVLGALRRDGFVVSSLDALTGDPTVFPRVRAHVQDLLDEQSEAISERRTALAGSGPEKRFLVELMGHRPVLRQGDPVVDLALAPSLLAVADGYYRMRTDLRDLNVWLNLHSDRPRTSSQRWHRDLREDHAVLKCFVFLEDVDEGNGPTEYVVGTHRGRGARWRVPTSYDGIGYRVEDEESFERDVPVEQRRYAMGPAGSVAFLDTRGFHRGGDPRDRDRLLLQALFASGSSIRNRVLQVPVEDEHALGARVAVSAAR